MDDWGRGEDVYLNNIILVSYILFLKNFYIV